MALAEVLLAGCCLLSGASSEEGLISGAVLNATDARPVAHAQVALRIRVEGQLVLVSESTADAEGRFLFRHLPVDPAYQYLPGANRDGVHFPGPPVRLTPQHPSAHLDLVVCDAIAEPCPLVCRRHEILIRPEPGVLRVSETLLVDNPTTRCFVGRAAQEGVEPVTLRLSIPADFVRTTFDEEFYGRRFVLSGGKLVTGIPWTPGQRELRFTYVLPNEKAWRLWERPLDLPTEDLTIRVVAERPQDVSCDLPRSKAAQSGEVIFQSPGKTLPAGHVLRLELGQLPVPWIAYARWTALAVLAGLMGSAVAVAIRRRLRPALPGEPDETASAVHGQATAAGTRRSKARRRRSAPNSSGRRAA